MYRKCHALGKAWPLAILSVINHYVMISKLAIFGFWPLGLGHNVDCNFPKSNEPDSEGPNLQNTYTFVQRTSDGLPMCDGIH